MPEQQSRRKFVRIPFELVAILRSVDRKPVKEPPELNTADLSLDGLGIDSKEPLVVGSLIELDVQLPDDEELHFVGRVRWHKGKDPVRNGVQIVEISDREQFRLKSFLDKIVIILVDDDQIETFEVHWSEWAVQGMFIFFIVLALFLYIGSKWQEGL